MVKSTDILSVNRLLNPRQPCPAAWCESYFLRYVKCVISRLFDVKTPYTIKFNSKDYFHKFSLNPLCSIYSIVISLIIYKFYDGFPLRAAIRHTTMLKEQTDYYGN